MREMMALGDKLRADDKIMYALRHFAQRILQQGAARQIARQYGKSCLGEELRHFFRQSFDARTTGHELARRRAFRTLARDRFAMAAMMAHQLLAEAVLD